MKRGEENSHSFMLLEGKHHPWKGIWLRKGFDSQNPQKEGLRKKNVIQEERNKIRNSSANIFGTLDYQRGRRRGRDK